MTQDKLLLTTEETCETLSIGRTRLYELMRAGEIVPVRIGRCLRFRSVDLERFVAGLAGGAA